jgi:ABC-type polysaccharide/polyol phosphate transport system ATPase subunit
MTSRLIFDRVWKKFHRGAVHDSLRDLIPDVARRLVGRGPQASELQQGDFWAVRDLSFEVGPGQTLGIIGPNGSGKSTTLKILTRIMAPSRGHASVTGRLGALIEVAAGFHGDLTGRENVFLQGAIMGMRSADIARKFDQIVEFSGVEDAIDTPVKRYSSGMSARLGFSIAAHLEPDVLIIDEVLAVGDLEFQERAFGRLRDLAQSGIPVVLVSHQLDRVAQLCSEAILLNQGAVVCRGTAGEAIAAYVRQHAPARTEGGGMIEFDSVRLINGETVRSGQRCTVLVTGRVPEPLSPHVDPILVRVRSLRTGAEVYVTRSKRLGLDVPTPGPFAVRIELQANLPPASYMIEVAARDMQVQRDVANGPAAVMQVVNSGEFMGTVQLNAQMTMATAESNGRS